MVLGGCTLSTSLSHSGPNGTDRWETAVAVTPDPEVDLQLTRHPTTRETDDGTDPVR
jgi:hypothetical protein